MNARGKAARTAVATVCLLAAALAGCSTPHDTPSPTLTLTPTKTVAPTPMPSSTPTREPAVAAAESAVLEAYRGYWAAKVTSYADPTKDQDPDLARFADDTALSDAQSTIFTLRSSGISIPGAPTLSPVVSKVALGGAPTATITDCVDATAWQPIYTATGASAAAPGQALRVLTESTAFVAEGQWRIRTSIARRDQTC
jgi:hypothetical protein